MHDVARLAGVSHQTVSRVLNNLPNVSDSTRKRVLQAIDQLDYRPNQMARGLVTRKSGRIGVISLESLLFGPSSSLLGIEQAARRAGYSVAVAVLGADEPTQDLSTMLAGQAVDGLIVIAPSEAAAANIRAISPQVPVVAVEASYDSTMPVAAVDQYRGAQQATEHLMSLGHATVWQLAGPADWIEARDRIEGWRAALSEAGAVTPPLIRGDWSAASGYRAALQLAGQGEVTAVFAANDQMAVGMLHGFHEAGLRVPDDVSVVGFDDIPEAEYLIPALTTVRQDFKAVGHQGVELLTKLIAGEEVSSPSLIQPELVIRQSSRSPTLKRRVG